MDGYQFRWRAMVATTLVLVSLHSSEADEPRLMRRIWSKVRPTKAASAPPATADRATETVADDRLVFPRRNSITPPKAPPAELEPEPLPVRSLEAPAVDAISFEDEVRQATPVPPLPLPLQSPSALPSFERQSFSLEQLQQLAIENNPTAREAAAVVEKARGQMLQAGLYPNPVLGYQASEVGNEGKAGQQGLFVGQEIVTGGKLRLARNVESQDVERLNWQYQAQLQRVLTDVRIRFVQALGAQRELLISDQLSGIAEQSVKDMRLRAENAGEATQSDVLQLELDLNQILITQQNAKRKLDASQRRLAYVVGDSTIAEVSLSGELERTFADRSFESEWAKLELSPVLEAAAWRINRASALVRKEQAQPIPNFDVTAGVQYDNSSEYTIANVQVGIPLPIHNRNQGNIRSAVAEYKQAREAEQRLQLKLRDQLAEALQNYETAVYQEERYRSVVVPMSEQNLDLTTDAWRVGNDREDGFLKLVIARRSYYEAKLAHVRALTEARVAEATLDGLQLTGGLDAPDE